jgi:hypothetical protein
MVKQSYKFCIIYSLYLNEYKHGNGENYLKSCLTNLM